MDIAALLVSVVATLVAVVALLYGRRSAEAARLSAVAATDAERRAGAPILTVTLSGYDTWLATYELRNTGSVDLSELVLELAEPFSETVQFGLTADDLGHRSHLGGLPVASSIDIVAVRQHVPVHLRALASESADRSWLLPLELPRTPRPGRVSAPTGRVRRR